MMKSASSVSNQHHNEIKDGFDKLWGSQTKWKTSPFPHNLHLPSMQPRGPQRLPSQDLRSGNVVGGDMEKVSGTLDLTLSTPPADHTHIPSKPKRRIRDSVSSSVSLPKLLRSSVLSFNSVMRGAKRSATLPVKRLSTRGRQTSRLPTMSKATQTSPRMLEIYQKSEKNRATDDTHQAEMYAHPGIRIPTPDTSTPSLLRRLMARSSLSPRSGSDSDDYFQTKLPVPDSSTSSPRTMATLASSSTTKEGRSRRTTPQERTGEPLDTTDSRSTPSASSKNITSDRSSSEDKFSSVLTHSMPVSQLQRLQARGYKSRPQHSRPLNGLFRKKSSPLNQEIKRAPTDIAKRLPRSETIDFWSRGFSTPDSGTAHLQLYKPLRTPGIDTDVPDHLIRSPLCPLHPQNKSFGLVACPQHGRLRDEDLKDNQIEVHTPTSQKSDSSSIHTVELIRPFTLNVPDHLPDSPLCPANPKYFPDGKGVCVLHGRPQVHRNGQGDDPAPVTRSIRS